MFEKILPLFMYTLLLATFVFAAVGFIALLNLMLTFFGVGIIELTVLKVGLMAFVLSVGVSFLR